MSRQWNGGLEPSLLLHSFFFFFFFPLTLLLCKLKPLSQRAYPAKEEGEGKEEENEKLLEQEWNKLWARELGSDVAETYHERIYIYLLAGGDIIMVKSRLDQQPASQPVLYYCLWSVLWNIYKHAYMFYVYLWRGAIYCLLRPKMKNTYGVCRGTLILVILTDWLFREQPREKHFISIFSLEKNPVVSRTYCLPPGQIKPFLI